MIINIIPTTNMCTLNAFIKKKQYVLFREGFTFDSFPIFHIYCLSKFSCIIERCKCLRMLFLHKFHYFV